MKPFAYERAMDVGGAVAAVAARADAVFLAGGTNLVDHMKLGVTSPELLVDVTRLELDAIEDTDDGGLRIGAGVSNADLAADRRVRDRFPVLSQALLAGASGQLRTLASTGGNLLQRTRCGYFQDITTPCNKREPGSGCSAIGGVTRAHAILGASEQCIAVHASDMAVALVLLDAVVDVQGPGGARSIPARDLHRLPGDEPERDTVLEHGELIVAVRLAPLPLAVRSAYRKVRDRASYAFALVSVAAAVDAQDGVIREARIALGGVAHKPWRAEKAEAALRDAPATQASLLAAADAELADAEPAGENAFKIPLTRATIVATVRDLIGEELR
jgi:xanthine dehydrogenase YagS FAD-binding subunit